MIIILFVQFIKLNLINLSKETEHLIENAFY